MFFRCLTGFVALTMCLNSAAHADGGWKVGGAVAFSPKYEGSDEYRVIGAPIILPDFSRLFGSSGAELGSRMSFRGIEDVRFRVLEARGFELGAVAGYKFERDDNDAARLNGLGDVEGGLILGGYVGYRIGGLLLDVAYRDQVTAMQMIPDYWCCQP